MSGNLSQSEGVMTFLVELSFIVMPPRLFYEPTDFSTFFTKIFIETIIAKSSPTSATPAQTTTAPTTEAPTTEAVTTVASTFAAATTGGK